MEKKKSNPFHIVLILVTLLIAGGLLGFGFMKKSQFDKDTITYQNTVKDLNRMESRNGYPSQETVDKLTNSLIAYKGKIEGLRNALKTSAVGGDFKNVPSAKFASVLGKANKDVKALYEKNDIILPNNWHMGFEKYTTVPAPKNATGELTYQLQAIQWLHETLAAHKPAELRNLYREPLAAEFSSAGDDKKAGNTSQHASLPIEISFVAYEEDAREFLNSLVKSNKYLFTLDTVKFKLLAPEVEEVVVDDEETPDEDVAENTFDSIFEIDDVEEVSEEDNEGEEMEKEVVDVLSEEKLFNQELGQEMVAVFLDLNLVYLTTQEPLPEIK